MLIEVSRDRTIDAWSAGEFISEVVYHSTYSQAGELELLKAKITALEKIIGCLLEHIKPTDELVTEIAEIGFYDLKRVCIVKVEK